MSYSATHQKGFSTIEALLLVVIVGLVGFTGYYVYHANKATTDTFNSSAKVAQSSPVTTKKVTPKPQTPAAASSATSQQYFTIKEWGVRAAYSGKTTLVYALRSDDPNTAVFTSQELLAADKACVVEDGGLIARYHANDPYGGEGNPGDLTAVQYANSLGAAYYGHVGDYYYFFSHTQAGCGSDPEKNFTIQNQTNNDVESLVPKLEAAPGS